MRKVMNKNTITDLAKIAVFQKKEIRKILHKNEWWFSVADIVEVLTDSVDVKQYIKKMRQRDPELNSYWGTICTYLEVKAKILNLKSLLWIHITGTRN